VNRGNCYYAKEKYVEACKYYMEAVQAEVDCTDAIYNLGMAQMKMKEFTSARKQFDKLLAILPDNPDALYQIASILEIQAEGEPHKIAPAREVFKRLHGVVPTDPRVLAKLGSLFNMEGDEPQAFYYHELAYRHYPVDMDVISWLGAYYVKMDVYEKAPNTNTNTNPNPNPVPNPNSTSMTRLLDSLSERDRSSLSRSNGNS